MSLKPCPYRHVGDEGHILCDKIKTGDREVSPNVCRACPVSQINCAHLRAVLDHQAHPPVVVRWGNGKTEVWDDDTPSISMHRAACAEKVIPIHSPRDCANCSLRQPLVLADGITLATPPAPAVAPKENRRRAPARPLAGSPIAASQPVQPVASAPISPVALTQPIAQIEPPALVAQTPPPPAPAAPVQPNVDKRSTVVAQKIIQLQEWLAKNVAQKKTADADEVRPIAQEPPRARAVGEEKRVGWTD